MGIPVSFASPKCNTEFEFNLRKCKVKVANENVSKFQIMEYLDRAQIRATEELSLLPGCIFAQLV